MKSRFYRSDTMRRLSAVFLLAVLSLAGCTAPSDDRPPASGAADPSSSATGAPSDAEGVVYSSLEELRLALVSAGEQCDSLQVLDGGADGDEPYGICMPDGDWGVYVYPTVADVDAVVERGDDSMEPGVFLLGTNWMIGLGSATSIEDIAPVQAALGGVVWKADEPFVRSPETSRP